MSPWYWIGIEGIRMNLWYLRNIFRQLNIEIDTDMCVLGGYKCIHVYVYQLCLLKGPKNNDTQ